MEKRIYSCATAHLDTIWNWDFEHTVYNCLYNTLYDNFYLFEKYKDYKFNFEGSYRYELFEEYYPEEFEKMKKYIADGKWNVTGSAYENGDVNVPSPEALFRNVLYGNGYFRKKFGKTSKEIYLPDCFGFGYALPSIIRHSNLLGFTTQKLTWGSAYGTPFDIGKWYGVNGKYCFAAVKPDAYVLTYKNIRQKKDNVEKLKENEEKYNLPWTFSFHGAGDQGGAPEEKSVQILQKEIDENNSNDVKVLSVRSDQIYDDLNALSDEQKEKLPSWNNELVMRDHGAGGYTSRAIGKRWNRKCEELADVTERSAVLADWLGGADYPKVQLEKAWKRTIAHQFHDDLPGTSIQREYRRSWNDYILSLNQLENEFTHSAGVVSKALDTSWVKGKAVVVNNSIEQARTDIVKFNINVTENKYISVKDSEGNVMPSQILSRNGDKAQFAFVCTIPSLGYKVFDLQECDEPCTVSTEVKATLNSLENENYRVTFNDNGEISSIFDKNLSKELLKEPIRHQLIDYAGSFMWPAWELTYKSICSDKIVYPKLENMRVLYSGAASAAIEIVQKHGNSEFKSIVSLDAFGSCVKVENEIEWWEQRTLLKDRFALTASNPKATYDLGLGAIERGNNNDKLFEVPAQKWADISADGFGISVISDSKYGWDKPSDNVLRMTVLHTPARNFQCESMQSLMELGINRYGFAVHSHSGDLTSVQKCAREFNQPLTALVADKHEGILTSEYSFGELNKNNVILRALKQAEDLDEIVVRFNEGANVSTKDVHFKLGDGIESAREVYASEETIGDAVIENGELIFNIDKYDVKSFALKLKPAKKLLTKPVEKQLDLVGDYTLFTQNKKKMSAPHVPYSSLTVPKEIKPDKIVYKGITFDLTSDKAVRCAGQKIELNGEFEKVYLLAFSESGDRDVQFKVDGKTVPIKVHSAYERIGIWDLFGMKEAANIKECNLAYVFTHAHNEQGEDVIGKHVYAFSYELNVKGASSICLPNDKNIVLLAATAIQSGNEAVLGLPMYDRISGRKFENKLSARDKLRVAFSKLPYNATPAPPKFKRNR